MRGTGASRLYALVLQSHHGDIIKPTVTDVRIKRPEAGAGLHAGGEQGPRRSADVGFGPTGATRTSEKWSRPEAAPSIIAFPLFPNQARFALFSGYAFPIRILFYTVSRLVPSFTWNCVSET